METLLTIIGIVQRLGVKKLIIQIISRMVVIIGLVITTAIMVCATFVAGLIHMHSALLNMDIQPMLALAYTCAAVLCIIAGLLALIVWQLHRLSKIPDSMFEQSRFTTRAANALDAFHAGLMED